MKLFKYFNNKVQDMSLGKKLILSYIIIIFVPIFIFSLWTFRQFKQTAIEDIVKKNSYLLEIEKSNINSNIEALQVMAQRVTGDTKFIDYIRNQNTSTTEELVNFNLDTIINVSRLQYFNPKINTISVFTNNAYVKEIWPIIYNESRIDNKPWFKKVINLNGGNYWMINYKDKDKNNDFKGTKPSYENGSDDKIALCLDINYLAKKHLGIIRVDMLSKDFFVKMYNEQDLESQVIIIDNNEKVYSNDNNKFFQNKNIDLEDIRLEFLKHKDQNSGSFRTNLGNEPFVIVYNYIKNIDSYMVNIISLQATFFNINSTRNLIIFVTIGILIILSVVTYFINAIILKKLHLIIQSMKKIQQGDFNIKLEVRGKDEVGELAHHFRKMLEKINELITEAVVKRSSTKDAELRALQTQIDSHFLYNTLENIKMAAEIEGQFLISDSLTSLGDMMRYNMRWKNEYVHLNEEIAHITNYIALMNVRWNNRIKLQINMEEKYLEHEVLKMSLQPIVENSVKHGFYDSMDGDIKEILIKAHADGNIFIIEVVDDGVGMTEDELSKLNSKIQTSNHTRENKIKLKEKGNGIGLINVNERLKLFYGIEYGIKISSIKGQYTKVEVILPCMIISEGEMKDA